MNFGKYLKDNVMSVFSEESLQLRRELAYACRILAANGQNDTVYGHVSRGRYGDLLDATLDFGPG